MSPAGVNVTKDVARQAALPNNLAINEYAYVSVAIYRSLKANTGAPEVPVVGKHMLSPAKAAFQVLCTDQS